jgi:hypothetical protein
VNREKLIEMLMKAGFEYTSDLLSKLDKLEKLIEIEREACAQIAFNSATYIEAAKAIRSRGN